MVTPVWHFWLDILMALLSVLLVISSTLLWVVFPRGYYAARAVWVAIHKWGGLALVIAALAHVALHWRWLARMSRREFSRLTRRERAQETEKGDCIAET